jgi:hypothetical protein
MAADSHIYFLANGVEDCHKLIYGYGCGYGRPVRTLLWHFAYKYRKVSENCPACGGPRQREISDAALSRWQTIKAKYGQRAWHVHTVSAKSMGTR